MANQGDQRTRCVLGCAKTFTRSSDMRRHVMEQHYGSKICCDYLDCNYSNRRQGRVMDHMKKAHHSQINTNKSSSSASPPASPQSPAPSNYYSPLNTNFNFNINYNVSYNVSYNVNYNYNFDSITPSIPVEFSFRPEAQSSIFESQTTFDSEGSSSPEPHPFQYPRAGSAPQSQTARYRVLKQHRVRRQKPCHPARTSFTASPHAHLVPDIESTPSFHPTVRESLPVLPQRMPCNFSAGQITNGLSSLSLHEWIVDQSTSSQPPRHPSSTSSSEQSTPEPFEYNYTCRRDTTGDWAYFG